MVARYAKTQMKELELTVNRFEQAGVKVNGFILNDIQREAGGYGYGYNYAYAYKATKDENWFIQSARFAGARLSP